MSDGQSGGARFEIAGESESVRRLHERIAKVARRAYPVLVTGPSGSGKELVARAIHAQSRFASGPFEAVNCAGLPEAVADSLLFGHDRGAFTSAERRHDGHVTRAAGGTLFLDEIAELPLLVQAKLLRVIERHPYRALGGTTDLSFAGRIVAATHADLARRVREGRFREDLLQRLNIFAVRVPSLAERAEDIPLLAMRFARDEGEQLALTEPAMTVLRGAPWPGNVRQLHAVLLRLVVASDGAPITERLVREELSEVAEAASPNAFARAVLELPDHDKLAAAERVVIDLALASTDGNITAAAEMLGVDRKAVERRIRKGLARAHRRGQNNGRGEP